MMIVNRIRKRAQVFTTNMGYKMIMFGKLDDYLTQGRYRVLRHCEDVTDYYKRHNGKSAESTT